MRYSSPSLPASCSIHKHGAQTYTVGKIKRRVDRINESGVVIRKRKQGRGENRVVVRESRREIGR